MHTHPNPDATETATIQPHPDTHIWLQHIARQEAFVGTTQRGVILLGDISGYTGLITRTELTHAREIMQFIFEAIFESTGKQFLVNEIEGDAIFAYCVEPSDPALLLAETLKQVNDYGHAFYHARQAMVEGRMMKQQAAEEVCSCGACSNIGGLSFKFIIHYGEFGFTQVGPFVKLVGSSVIVAHRLLKNSVPGNSYVLLTNEALEHLPADTRSQFTPLLEKIEHFGDVAIGYRTLDLRAEDAQNHA